MLFTSTELSPEALACASLEEIEASHRPSEFGVLCEMCHRGGPEAPTEDRAVAAALGLGWVVKQPNAIGEFVTIAKLSAGAEVLCPACWRAEFEL